MTVQLSGWYDEENGWYVGRVRTLTEDLNSNQYKEGACRRFLEEFMPNEFGVDPDPGTFTRRDLADDESVPEEERVYSYVEMHS